MRGAVRGTPPGRPGRPGQVARTRIPRQAAAGHPRSPGGPGGARGARAMNAMDLLGLLLDRGVVVEARGERLRVDALKGVLSPELRRALLQHKAELLDKAELLALLRGESLPGPGRLEPAPGGGWRE